MKVPISKSIFTQEDMDHVLQPLSDGWVVQGPKVEEFESMWSQFTKAEYSIATTSCTSALFLSIDSLDLEEDDEVIVPALSWISTANVVENIGCKTVFCDIDLSTFNINLDDLRSKITENTKAIIPVHLFGYPIDIEIIKEIIKDRKIHIIEDAACGFGSYVNDVHVGTKGTFGCFSFHPRKAISTGEGGMITLNNQQYLNKIRSLRDHGMNYGNDIKSNKPSLMNDHENAGYNFRMTDIQASLGISQMNRANKILRERHDIAHIYDEAFNSNDEIGNPVVSEENFVHGYQSYACIFKPKDVYEALLSNDYDSLINISEKRNKFMDDLADAGIGTRPPTHAIHTLSYYKDKYKISPHDYPSAWAANICGFSIPIFPGLSEDDQDYVINTIAKKLN
tara:strand:+ start:4463 stop:5647 length:1185 start_codon:yes stop_codon:yes gene_type:complete